MPVVLPMTPRGRGATAVLHGVLVLLAALILVAWPGRASAQSNAVTIAKTLCQGPNTNCGLQTVANGASVYYRLTLTNTSSAPATVTIRDALPAGFTLAGYACAATVGPNMALTPSTAQPLTFSVTVPVAGLQCAIAGSFAASAPSNVSNVAEIVSGASSNPVATFVDPSLPLPSNLSIKKSADLQLVNIATAPQVVTYTITITNSGTEDVYLGRLLAVEDRMSLFAQGVVVNAALLGTTCAVFLAGVPQPNADCLGTTPAFQPTMPVLVASAVPAPLARWVYPPGSPGLLRAGHSMVLRIEVRLSRVPGVICILAPNADGIDNHAYLTVPAAATGGVVAALNDSDPSDNSAHVGVGVETESTQVNQGCNASFQPSSVLQVTKIELPPVSVRAWNSTIRYRVTVRNVSQTPNLRIRRIRVDDWVVEGPETPPFDARWVAHLCTPNCTTTYVPFTAQHLSGNGDTRRMLSATLLNQPGGGLLPGDSISFTIDLRYSTPQCDSYPQMNPKTILNIGRVVGWEQQDGTSVTQENQVVEGAAVTRMEQVPPCPLIVAKSASTPQILFAAPPGAPSVTYTIVYRNPHDTQSFAMGTLGDMMRIRPPLPGYAPYAVQLGIDYSYNCTVLQGNVTGYPATNPAGPGNLNTANVTITQLPQQGVRLIRNTTPVVFGPKSRLRCDISVWVHQPPQSDPYCSAGELENAAILDGSSFYDPNTPWQTMPPPPTPPGMWASAASALPRCHNLIVNKEALRPWTWVGGPLAWRLRVTNVGGAPITGPGVVVTDTMDGGVLASSAQTACIPAVSVTSCAYAWSPALTASNPGRLNINRLAIAPLPRPEIRTTINVAQAPASAVANTDACNRAVASFWPPSNNALYWKSGPPSGLACIRILDTRTLTVVKRVANPLGLPLPATFKIDVVCTNPNSNYNGPNATLSLAANGTGTVPNVPVGSTCTASENPPPAPPPATAGCPSPAWAISFSPPGVTIVATSNPTSAANTITVNNDLVCGAATPVTLVLRKFVMVNGGTVPRDPRLLPPAWQPSLDFRVTVTCGANVRQVNLNAGNNYQAPIPLAPGATCSIAETSPPAFPIAGCRWVPSYPQGTAIINATGTIVRDVYNTQACP